MRFSLPQNRVHILKYVRMTLASTSMAHWYIIKSKVTKIFGWDGPIAHSWRSVLEIYLGTIPEKPPPLVVDAASKQFSIQRSILHSTRAYPQGGPARPAIITLQFLPSRPGHKRKIHTTVEPRRGSDAPGDKAAIHNISARSEPRRIKYNRRSIWVEEFLVR